MSTLKVTIGNKQLIPDENKKVSNETFAPKVENKQQLQTAKTQKQKQIVKHKQEKLDFPSFKIAKQKYKPLLIIPHANLKNDKVDLFVDSFAGSYKEMYHRLRGMKFNKDGLYLPEQDKVFFEILIEKNKFETYIVTNESLSEYTKQQIAFSWDCNIKEKDTDILDNVNVANLIAYEMSFKYPSALSLRIDARTQEKPLREFLELSRMLMDKERAIIQFGFQPCEETWWKDAERSLEELPKRKNVSETSRMKLGYSGFDTCLRILVESEDLNRRLQISRGFIMALKQMNGDNELVENLIKDRQLEKWFENKVKQRKIDVPLRFKKRMIMTWKEIGNFLKFPQRKLQTDFGLEANEREEIELPKVLLGKDGIPIGYAEFKGKKYEIVLPMHNLDDLSKSYVFTGSPRMGKDTAQINLIVEAAKGGCGAFVPDVVNERGNDRGMADSIRDALPPDKVIDLNLCDYFNPVYFGLEDIIGLLGENGLNVVANNLVKILGLDSHAATQRLCRLVAKACDCNVYKMYCFLQSDNYARQVYENIKVKDELLALKLEHEYLNNSKNSQAKDALLTRLDEILGNDHFRNMMAQERNEKIDFEKWIRENKVVLLRMRKVDIGDIGVQILMYLISLKIFWIKKIIETDDVTFLVYNEPHQYMSAPLEELLASMVVECPKYRLSFLIAFHDPSYLSKNLYEAIKSASINWFLFKNTNMRMYESIEAQLEPITISQAMKTKQYEAIFLPFVGGEQLTPFFVSMLPPPKHRQKMYDNSHLTNEHSKIYGRPVNEVLERIKQIELSMYQVKEEPKEEKTKKKRA